MRTQTFRNIFFAILLVMLIAQSFRAIAADPPTDPVRDREMRDRYEAVLLKNPFQERAFDQVFDGYSKVEGVDKWVESLKLKAASDDAQASLILLGKIYDRQFKISEAVAAFVQAKEKGEDRPQFKLLLGTLYYKAGEDDKAAELLESTLDTITDLDQRSAVCRMLGNLYLRQGKRDQAIAVWKRISEQNPQEIFSQLELAEIYEDNRMWNEAIAVYRRIVELSTDDPYRRCRALRSIGQCHVQSENFKDAIATYEQALELVSPGNWLFEDLKIRLVGVYQDLGDLAGLVKYVTARLDQNPGDAEFRDLLAETYTRMAKFDDAEKQYRLMLERDPRSGPVCEKLIALYTRTGRKEETADMFEKLIQMFPSDGDYLRRLGEFHLHNNNPDLARTTWRRWVQDPVTAERLAQLAGWYENYDFPDDAVAAYQQALEKKKNPDWVLRLAALKFQKGDETNAVSLWMSAIDPATSKVEDYAEIASILESNQKLDEAAKLRQAAVEKDPANLESQLGYARILARQQKFEAAAAAFEMLANQDTNEFMATQGEAGRLEVWRDSGVLAEKQKELERVVQQNPADARSLNRLARLYERAGQQARAIQLYEARRQTEPDNVEYLRSLAALYKSAKQVDQSIETYRALLDKDRNRARVYYKELLDIYLSVDLKDEAIAAAEKIVGLAPSDPEARLALAQVYQVYRQMEKAFGEYRYALRLEPGEPDYYRQYGEALQSEKRYGEAQEAFRKMLDVAKEDSTRLAAVAGLARLYLQQDQLDSLISEFNRRIRNTPKKLAAYEELAAIHKESGQIFKSVEVLESGLQNVDDKSAALKALIRTGYEAQDFAKVRSYYEQLLALSGKPTAQEYEKLGQIYAQMGEIDKARETWNRILSESPKDPKAADRLATLLRTEGFTDEALAAKSKAVELDPNDYRRRFEYAQMLAQNEQHVEAIKQLALILEQGEREQKKEETPEKKVQPVSRNRQNSVNPYQFIYGNTYYRGYYGGGWQGTFKEFRPRVLQTMASLAQQTIGEDSFVEQFQSGIKKDKDNLDMKRDLLTVLQMFNRADEALKLAEEILAAVPDDVDLLQQTALLYSARQQLDKAIPLLEKLVAAQPKYRVQAVQGLVPLYFRNKEESKALQLVNQILEENARDQQLYYAMGVLLQQNGKFDEAARVYNKIREIDPSQTDNVRYQLAQLGRQAGKPDEARAMFKELLLTEPSANRGAYGNWRRVEIYTPVATPNQGVNYGNPMQQLPANAFGYIDYMRQEALRELAMNQKIDPTTTNIFGELEEIARSYQANALPTVRNRAWGIAQLLGAQYCVEKEYDKAADLLAALRRSGMDDADWFNASLFIAQQKEDYTQMGKYYDELQQRYPAKSRDIAVGRTVTFIIAKRYDDAVKNIRELNQQRVPPGTVLMLIQSLIGVGEKKLAQQLLEEHLSGFSRNSQALATLAQLCAEDNDYDKAIALASEAWERKSHGRQNYYGRYYYAYYQTYYPAYSQVDNLLRELHGYYVGAGQSEILINRFKEQLEKQPGSIQAYENLAELYRLSEQRDKAIEIYQQLAEKRPHLLQAKRLIAQLHTEAGEFDAATHIYEELMKANPAMYQQLSWELRSLYQRIGKGKDLEKIEQKMVDKARDPNQLNQLAYQLKESGEIDKAIELWRKAARMSPGQPWIQGQLAGALVELGQLDEAVKLYQEWLDSPAIRSQGWVDYAMLQQLAGLYRATGRIEDLKARCDADLKKNSTDPIAKALQAQIAMFEKRFDDALEALKAAVQSGRDPNVIQELIHLADLTGRVDEVLALAEKSNQMQNFWDLQLVARLYFMKGDRKKGEDTLMKWSEQQLQQGNAGWVLQQTLQQLGQYRLWDVAESFVRKHRSDPLQPWELEQFDREIAERYVRDHRFEPVVNDLLARNSFKGRDLDLLKMIAQRYEDNRDGRRQVFLEKVCASDPSNRELAFQLAGFYDTAVDGEKKVAILTRLLEQEPNNTRYRQALGEAFIATGRSETALKSVSAWAAEKPVEARYTMLSQLQQKAGHLREARESLVRAAELADPSRKREMKIALAEFDAQQGEPEPRKQALQENFEARKDSASFQRYLHFLDSAGYADLAYTTFLTNKDRGLFDRFQGTEFVLLCLNQSDFKTPMDMVWQVTRYGDRWNRDSYFDPVRRQFQERGKLLMFVDDLHSRIEAEVPHNTGLLETAAQRYELAGSPGQALKIYDRIIQASPFNRSAALAKASLLLKLDRGDEAVKLLRDPKGIVSLDDELNATHQLIRALFKLERKAEAEAEIQKLLAWAGGLETVETVANVYLDQKQYDKAVGLFERAAAIQRSGMDDRSAVGLGKCYAELNRGDEAVKAWLDLTNSDNATVQLDSVHNWLLREGLAGLAVRLIEQRLLIRTNDVGLYMALADASQYLDGTPDFFEILKRAGANAGADKMDDLRVQMAAFIMEHNLIGEALKRLEAAPDPGLNAALAQILADSSGHRERAEQIARKVMTFDVENAPLQVRLGDALARVNQNTQACAWYRKALNSTNQSVRVNAARGLAMAGAGTEAVDVLKADLTSKPQIFLNDSNLLAAVARTGDAALIRLLSGVLADSAIHDSAKLYYTTLLDYYAGKTNDVREKLVTLAAAPDLAATQIQLLAGLCDEQGLMTPRAQLLNRLAAGGYGDSVRWTALSELVKTHLRAGDVRKAVAVFSELGGMWGTAATDDAIESLTTAATSENFNELKAAVLEVVRAKPDHDRVSNLLGLCAQIAARSGVAVTAAQLADEAGITGRERDETVAWDSLIETWQVSAPYHDQTQVAPFPPEIDYLAAAGDAKSKNRTVWTSTDPKKVLGIVRINRVLGLSDTETVNQVAYARTTIDSPQDRRVVFCLGSDDWVQVWVNGESVHTSSDGRRCGLDQDRFEVRLKKGSNSVLLKVGNVTDAWGFCLRIVEDKDGQNLARE